MLSVLIATHNGADTIERTLAALEGVTPPPGGWELLVVSNASRDDTEARVQRWRDRLPLRCLSQPRLGKAYAMNMALDQSRGDFIVMTDDDVLPAPDWLVEWRRVADAYPQCDIFGGAIVPEFDGHAPDWPMPERCYTALFGQTPAFAEGEIAPVSVCGANMGLRREVCSAGWRFREEFLVGERGLMGEDTDLVQRLAAAGRRVGFAPTAIVRHIVHRDQTSLIWMQRRFVRHGRTMFELEEAVAARAAGHPNYVPYWRLKAMVGSGLKLLRATVCFDRRDMFEQMTAIAYHLGAIEQALAFRVETPAH